MSASEENIDAADEYGRTALFFAALDGKPDEVLDLLKRGASLKADSEEDTPLHAAAQQGDPASITHLLTFFPEAVDTENKRYETMLHIAAADGHKEIISMLAQSFKANIEAKNYLGQTPIFLAACFGHVECLELFVRLGANASYQDTEGHTPLHFAANLNQLNAVKFLLQTTKPDRAEAKLAREFARENGHLEISTTLSTYIKQKKRTAFSPTFARSAVSLFTALMTLPTASTFRTSGGAGIECRLEALEVLPP
jgi:ankyrin repeat protein